eukprot:2679773-Amphidinium_carterae.11
MDCKHRLGVYPNPSYAADLKVTMARTFVSVCIRGSVVPETIGKVDAHWAIDAALAWSRALRVSVATDIDAALKESSAMMAREEHKYSLPSVKGEIKTAHLPDQREEAGVPGGVTQMHGLVHACVEVPRAQVFGPESGRAAQDQGGRTCGL